MGGGGQIPESNSHSRRRSTATTPSRSSASSCSLAAVASGVLLCSSLARPAGAGGGGCYAAAPPLLHLAQGASLFLLAAGSDSVRLSLLLLLPLLGQVHAGITAPLPASGCCCCRRTIHVPPAGPHLPLAQSLTYSLILGRLTAATGSTQLAEGGRQLG